jgi:hypothetical protein
MSMIMTNDLGHVCVSSIVCRRYRSPTLLHSRSQHLTCLSSPHENRYGCRVLTATPRTVETWPVNDNFNVPVAKSQI